MRFVEQELYKVYFTIKWNENGETNPHSTANTKYVLKYSFIIWKVVKEHHFQLVTQKEHFHIWMWMDGCCRLSNGWQTRRDASRAKPMDKGRPTHLIKSFLGLKSVKYNFTFNKFFPCFWFVWCFYEWNGNFRKKTKEKKE